MESAVQQHDRFEVLDGLRGIAAFAVLLLHISPIEAIDLVPHATLAVDFFFGLSGFVIAAAYEKRLAGPLGIGAFMRLRMIRLYPLICLGAVFGAIGYVKAYDLQTLLLLFITGIFLIPTPLGSEAEGRTLIAINPASWSLLSELLVNLLYAVIAPRLESRILVAVVIASAVALIITGSFFGGLDIGNLWGNGWAGIPRVLFSFFAGVTLLRLRRQGKLRHFTAPAPLIAISLILVMMVPHLGRFNLLYDTLIIMFFFPILLVVGSNTSPGKLAATCNLFGAVSYPAYILQSGITTHLRALPTHFHLTGWTATAFSLMIGLIFLIFSWLVLKKFDEPLRARLQAQGKLRANERPTLSYPPPPA